MAEALLYGIVVILIVLNIVLLMLYYSAKSNPYYVVYDEETKSALKRRVTSLKEDLESELVDFDVEEWEKTLEESIEEEVMNL
ncbi:MULTISPECIES: hypothetical protein [Thermococcus]|uniref:Uncharacterized protein n=1 Tax=Thermococcus thioreducens TaxID=277988 RepID=A0A0Q2M2I8_9EURY|nr:MULTISPECIES: hypothetical protein [Thermococcus]ASJ12908.1 hypothetical protein A3L14_08430 [Thermococcus thioreducens]KQH82098.1 hypothetical protein AMR53_07710 [Thermococcus thioreducens]SEV83562.1 hypothetical protein SAMN05216170_0259 [Thermococcus thioreducens]